MQLLRTVWGFGCKIEEMVHLWKLFCRSVLEQSCVVWGSSISKENEEDLERAQKSFAKLVLREKYQNYESALRRLDLEDLGSRRKTLMLKFCRRNDPYLVVASFWTHQLLFNPSTSPLVLHSAFRPMLLTHHIQTLHREPPD